MKILFRADCDRSIGTGHLFRCWQMADYFNAKGWATHFLVNDNEFSQKTVAKYDYSVLPFNRLSDEVHATERFLQRPPFDVIVVDFVTKNQLHSLMDVFGRHANRAVVAITDDFNLVTINADILIACHPRQIQDNYPSKRPVVLTGERYLIVSPEFSQNRIRVRKNVQNVLISFGGHDPNNVSRKTAQFIIAETSNFDPARVKFHFLIGGIYRFEDELRHILSRNEIQFILHKNLPSVIPLFYETDIAITAGGNTLYELCHMGVPCIAIGLNDRQHQACLSLHDKGLIKYAGFHDQTNQAEFADFFLGLMNSSEQRIELHNNCIKHYDINAMDELYSLLTSQEVKDETSRQRSREFS